ncbi:MAG TPA: DUF3857 domain-containing protein [Saprospiraceae bacterium]|nr:DUF3857 domain-containing protein [Saprospiraceae bacterium]
MQKHLIICILLWIFQGDMSAQTGDHEFGVVSVETFDMQVYDKDPEADAVVLFDIGHARFYEDNTGGFNISFTRTKRIKILRNESMDEVTVVNIPYRIGEDGASERLIRLQAFTYNLQHGIVTKFPLDPTQIFEERLSDSWKNKTFTFPRVKAGSVIEYQYELESPFLYYLADWEFQSTIPTIQSSYTVSMIPFYEYTFILQGADKFSTQSTVESTNERRIGGVTFKELLHTYVMTDVPAFRYEGFITSPGDYIIKMDFQLSKIIYSTGGSKEILTSWPKLITVLLDHADFGRYMVKAKKQAETILADQLNIQQIPEAERIKSIVQYVKSNYFWNGQSSHIASMDFKDFLTRKTGNSADINLFLNSLLEEAGISAHPVLMSTRNHGKIKTDYPFEHFFNYVLVLANDRNGAILLDGTDILLPYNRIPQRCINEQGLIIQSDSENWVSLESQAVSLEYIAFGLKCDLENEILQIGITHRMTEYEARAARAASRDTIDISDEMMGRDFLKLGAVVIQNAEQVDKPYLISIKGSKPLQKLNDDIIISPFLDYPESQNPFKQRSRTYPIDFVFRKSKQYLCVLEIPSGFQVSEIPALLQFEDHLLKMDYSTELIGDKLKLTAGVEFKKSVYDASDYGLLKTHFDTMIKKFNGVVILKPI